MTQYDLGQVVGADGQDGVDGSTIWYTSTAPTYANSKYTFTISNLTGKTGFSIAVSDLIFYDTYYYIVSAVNSTTVDCATRVSIKGSDASVTVVDNLNSDSSTSVLSAKQGKVLNTNKIETSAIVTSFSSTTSDSKVPSEKLVKTELDKKITTSSTTGLVKNDGSIDTTSYSTFDGNYNNLTNKPTIPSASSTVPSADTISGSYGSGTSYARSNHTHPKSSLYAESSHTHTKSQITDFPSLSTVATSGSYSDLSNKPSIPSKTSDLTNDSGFITSSSLPTKVSDLSNDSGFITSSSLPTKTSDLTNDGDGTNAFLTQHQSLSNYVQKSSTTGLLKNDGTIDTSAYITSSALSNYVQKSSTTGLLKNDGSVDTNSYLTSSAIANMITTSDVANNLTTTASGKVLDARQGKVLADLIGDAITYINQ